MTRVCRVVPRVSKDPVRYDIHDNVRPDVPRIGEVVASHICIIRYQLSVGAKDNFQVTIWAQPLSVAPFASLLVEPHLLRLHPAQMDGLIR